MAPAPRPSSPGSCRATTTRNLGKFHFVVSEIILNYRHFVFLFGFHTHTHTTKYYEFILLCVCVCAVRPTSLSASDAIECDFPGADEGTHQGPNTMMMLAVY